MKKTSAMGIIFANMHDENLPEISSRRTMASVPFAGRYRMIDFCLSGLANAGIYNIGVLVRRNYQSLLDHLGNGREWDLSRKRGGLVIFPPSDSETARGGLHGRRLATLNQAMNYLDFCSDELVVMSDCDIAYDIDFAHLIRTHVESGADVTAVYSKAAIDENMIQDNITFTISGKGSIKELRINDYKKGVQCVSMHVYVLRREMLIGLIKDATVRGLTSFESDFLVKNLNLLQVRGYECTGYHARIYDMQSYFAENMRLLREDNLRAMFPPERPVYTKVRDNAPVRYAIGGRALNSMVADGCVIEGEVENCVLFRDVHVAKGAVVKNCVVMQGSVIEEGVRMNSVVTDKNVTVCAGKILSGAEKYPMFISKGSRVE